MGGRGFRQAVEFMNQQDLEPFIRMTREPIDYAQITESVRSDHAGAVILFLGTVRELTNNRRTVSLDYDAYDSMAVTKMKELEDEARKQWNLEKISIVHRLGHLELGEISVAVALSSLHREEAFQAGKFLIDELKLRVPVWKKENWDDGTTAWVHPGNTVSKSNEE